MSHGNISIPLHYYEGTGGNDYSGYVGHGFTKSWSGANSPWVNTPRKKGLALRDNPYSLGIAEDRRDPVSLMIFNNPDNVRTGSPDQFLPNSAVNNPWTDADELKLLARLVDQVKNNEFNLGNFLGEGHETLSMFATNATRLASAARALRKGNFASAAKHLGVPSRGSAARRFNEGRQSLANGWLELQYGWMPLLKDIHAGADFLAKSSVNAPQKRRFSASGTAATQYVNQGGGGFKYDAERIVRKRYTVALTEDYSPVASLGLLDPEVVAWELTPFSFVADWFIPIGTFLETRAHVGRFVGLWIQSVKDVQTQRVRPFSSAIYTPMFGGMNVYSKNVTFERTANPNPPVVPLPQFKSMKKALSLRHVENALALVQQAFR